MTWLTCRLKGSKWHFRRHHFLRRHVFAGIVKFFPDDGDFHSRPRLDPAAALERKHEHEPEEAGPGSKIQRLSCVLPVAAVTGIDFPSHSWLFQKPWTYDYRVSSVDTKHGLEGTKMKKSFC